MMALGGLRVLDRTDVLPGAFCSMLLADMGADVIRIEPPGGETARLEREEAPGASAWLLAVHRNKRRLTVDLERPAGVALLQRLAATADVLVEDSPPEVARRPGIEADVLAAANPRLIHCSISAFGPTGPYAGREGSDLVAQAMSGIMSATGADGGAPAKVGVPIADLGAALFAVLGILSALRARHRTGGQRVDTSSLEAGVALSQWEATQYWYTGEVPRGLGTAHRLNAPYQAFRASDGHFTVGAANDNLWPRFATLLGLAHLVADPRFDSVARRLRHRAELQALVEAVTVTATRAHWLARCEAAGIPAGPIYTVPEALADPHAQARGMVQDLVHPELGALKSLGNPVKMSATPPRLRTPAPARGADTDAVLRDLGYADAEVAALRAAGVV
jgi:crotonobetainyl-CoA:carnitine CoA-transferase CaiB-like acyl-CoA transferase